MRTRRNIPGVMVNFPSMINELLNDDSVKRISDFVQDFNRPAVNIIESDNEYGIELVVPGFEKDHFNIEVIEGKLVVSAKVEEVEKDEKVNYSRQEFALSSFKRSFILPENKADEDKIDAQYVNGVLKILIAKKEEAKPKAPRSISVK